MKQTFFSFELIVVDDGSTDGTTELISSFSSGDDRVIHLKQNKAGRCSARNLGLDNLKGEWVCFLDSDDQYYPNHLQTHYDLILSHPNQEAFATEQKVGGKLKRYRGADLNKDSILVRFNHFVDSNPIQLNQLCYHAASLRPRFPEDEIPISEDLFFMRELTLVSPVLKVHILTNEVFEHVGRTMNSSTAEEIVFWNIKGTELFCERHPENPKLQDALKASTHVFAANILFTSGLRKEGWSHLKLASCYLRVYFDIQFYNALSKFLHIRK